LFLQLKRQRKDEMSLIFATSPLTESSCREHKWSRETHSVWCGNRFKSKYF